MERDLSTKRKLCFVHGTLPRPEDDAIKLEHCESYNNLVIDWIMNTISDSICRSILYIQYASELLKQSEKRFSLINGSRKYTLTKEIYAKKQNNTSISDYDTRMKNLGRVDCFG